MALQLPDDYLDLWITQAQKADTNQLATVQSTAEKWGATITALTGVFGLIALVRGVNDVSKLQAPWDTVGTLALLLALLGAFVAIGLAALAAQGTPAITYGDPLVFRQETI